MVLLGDSHAEHWFPAMQSLAVEHQMRLVVLAKSSCPAADVLAWQSRLNRPFDECQEWRRSALDRIRGLDPAIVVVSSYGRQPVMGGQQDGRVQRGIERTLRQLPAGSSVFWLSDNPEFGEPVPVCLSAHLRNTAACGALREDALDAERSAADAAAVRRAGGTYVDPSAWLCRDLRCPVISGNTLMYRDTQHLPAPYAATLAPALERVLFPPRAG